MGGGQPPFLGSPVGETLDVQALADGAKRIEHPWSIVNLAKVKALWRYDAEYWDPRHIVNEQIIAKTVGRCSVKKLRGLVKKVMGSAFYPSIADQYSETEGIPFIRVADLGDFFVRRDGLVCIPETTARDLRQIVLANEGDILIAKGGSIGGVCLVQPGLGVCATSRDVITIKVDSKKVESPYLVAFLKSKFGQLQLDRHKSQQVQAHLTFPAVETVDVVVPPRETQQIISKLVLAALSTQKQTQSLYAEAETLLTACLGLGALDLTPQTGYTANFKDFLAGGRLDAEYFQPKYARVMNALTGSGYPHFPLEAVIEPIRNGFDYREFTDEGTPYIRVGDVKRGRINLESAAKVAITQAEVNEQVNKDIDLRLGDVLLTRKGSFGNAAVVRQEHTRAIISSEIMLLRLRRDLPAPILPDYLALFLNSEVGYQQIERFAHGVAFYSISQPDLARVTIVIPPLEIQDTVTGKVKQALEAEKEAARLLEEAKSRVEAWVLGE